MHGFRDAERAATRPSGTRVPVGLVTALSR